MTDESDAIELVDLIKTILTTTEKTEKRMVQLCAIDAIGVHAQIVGELTDKVNQVQMQNLSLQVVSKLCLNPYGNKALHGSNYAYM